MAAISHVNSLMQSQPTRHNFVEKIHYAQTHDAQLYTLEKLNPASLNFNAQTPGYINLIISPFVVAKNLYTLTTKKIEATFIKYDLKTQTAMHVLNFINISLKTVLLLSYVGLAASEATIFLPYIVSLAAISSLMGICHSGYHLIQQNKFLKRYDFELLDLIISIQRKIKKKDAKSLKKALKSLLNKLYTQELFEPSTLKVLDGFSSQQELSTKDREVLSTLMTKVQNTYLLDTFTKIKARYFSFTEEEKKEQLKEALADFNQAPVQETLNKHLEKIEAGFLRKKLNLTSKIHSKLALQTIEKIDNVIADLSKEYVSKESLHQAKHHLRIIQFNGLKKRDILVTNIALYAISLGLAIVNHFIPLHLITTIALASIASAISWINHIDIYGNLESSNQKIDYYNCLPPWIKWIHQNLSKKISAKPLVQERISLS